MNRRNLALVLMGIAGVAALAVVALVLVNRSVPLAGPSAPGPAAPSPSGMTEASDGSVPPESELAAVALVIESQLGLEDVLVSQYDSTLELRFRALDVSASDTLTLMAGLFDWMDAAAPDKAADRIRLVMTVNGADAGFAEASRADIRAWRSGNMTAEAFVSSWNRVSLVSAE